VKNLKLWYEENKIAVWVFIATFVGSFLGSYFS
jgi:hypothetical protein